MGNKNLKHFFSVLSEFCICPQSLTWSRAYFLHSDSSGSDQDTIKIRYRNMNQRYSTVIKSVGSAEEHPTTSKFESTNSLGSESNHGVVMPKISLREIRVQGCI